MRAPWSRGSNRIILRHGRRPAQTGFRVVIYCDDHPAAHVHVVGDGEAKIELMGPDGMPRLVSADGFKRSDLRRAMDIVTDDRDELLRRWRESMADLTDDDIDAALERGRRARSAEPRVLAARYDRASRRMVVDLTNGCTFLFPPRSLQGLETASDDEIAAVEVLGCGSGLHWETGGADYTIAGLLAGRLGTQAYMEARPLVVPSQDRGEPPLEVG